MYFLRQLKKFGISPIILKRFYHAIIESVLTFSSRAVANGPVGPAMAGPIIEPANKKTLTFLFF